MASFKVEKRDYQLIVTVKLHLNEKLNEYGLNDFSEKFVVGLLKAKKINKKKIEYTGPIGVSLYNRLQNSMSKEEFFFIMGQFVDLFQEMEKAQLDVRKIVSDLRNVYINGQTMQIQFIYLPLQSIQNTNLLEIMYSIIYKVRPIAGQDDGYISRFISFLQKLKYFDSDKIEKYIEKEKKGNRRNLSNKGATKDYFNNDKINLLNNKPRMDYFNNNDDKTGLLNNESTINDFNNNDETGLLDDESTMNYFNNDNEAGLLNNRLRMDYFDNEDSTGLLNDKELTDNLDEVCTILTNDEESTDYLELEEDSTGLLNDEEPTGLLNNNYQSFSTLYRKSTGETILINKLVFRLGRQKNSCDYYIKNNAVSQSHANIITRGRQKFIVDLNSTNRTFVNEAQICSGQEVELYENDNIKLGNEEFIFHM